MTGVLAVLTLAGCAQPAKSLDVPALTAGTASQAAVPPVDDPGRAFTAIDIEFLGTMLPHHAFALQLDTLAQRQAADPRVAAFAAGERAVQEPEVEQMRTWLTGLGIDPASLGEHVHGGGRTSEQDVADLAALSGPAFDTRFVDLMLDHSLQATTTARQEAATGSNDAARRLASTIARRSSDDTTTLLSLR